MGEELPPLRHDIEWIREQEAARIQSSLVGDVTPEELAFVETVRGRIYEYDPLQTPEFLAIDPVTEIDAFFAYLDAHPEERAQQAVRSRLGEVLRMIEDREAVQGYIAQGLTVEQAIQRIVQDRDTEIQQKAALYKQIFGKNNQE